MATIVPREADISSVTSLGTRLMVVLSVWEQPRIKVVSVLQSALPSYMNIILLTYIPIYE